MSAPVYLFTGPEAGKRNDAVQAVKDSLKKKYGQIEEYLFYASESAAAEYMAVLQNESLFASASCVVVKNADFIKKKDEIEMITDWISSVKSDSSVLVLVSDEISVDSKIEKAVPSANQKKFWEMFENQKLPWLKNFFFGNGYSIEEDAAALILEMIENNTEALKNECSRFFVCFPKEHRITPDDVESVLAHTREEDAYSLFNAMAAYPEEPRVRLEKSLDILQKIRLSKDNASVGILARLTFCFRNLVLWQKLSAAGTADDFNLKINGFSSLAKKQLYGRAARIWSSGQAVAVLSLIAAADMSIRSGGSLLEDVLLQKLLYEIIMKKGAASASYEISD